MKEDVETLPEKEEVVVWVELTAQQRVFYKGIYSGQARAPRGCRPPRMPHDACGPGTRFKQSVLRHAWAGFLCVCVWPLRA